MKDVSAEIENLKTDVQKEDHVDSFMEPGKKRKGRPKGSTNKPKAVNVMGEASSAPQIPDLEATKKLVKPGVSALSALGVKFAEDETAAMQPPEVEVIVDSAAACINQYLPGVLGAHANAVVLSVTLAQWGLRVYFLRQASLAKLRQEKAMRAVQEPPIQ